MLKEILILSANIVTLWLLKWQVENFLYCDKAKNYMRYKKIKIIMNMLIEIITSELNNSNI